MPKRIAAQEADDADEGVEAAALPTWQAAGLALAVILGDVLNGSGVLLFGLLSIAVIWSLQRLHAHAPSSMSTAQLIASAPGAAPARAVSVVQYAAYVLMAAVSATSVGLLALSFRSDLTAGWLWPALSAAAALVAAVFVAGLPTRLLAPVAAVLAGFGLLVFFFVALSVLAKVFSGTAPIDMTVQMGTAPKPTEWGPVALVGLLALTVPGFEIPTVVSDRLRSVARPLGLAMALLVVCAATAWAAVNVATTGDFRYDAADLILIAGDMFGESVSLWMVGASIATATAVLLVLLWGATRVAHQEVRSGGAGLMVTAVAVGALAAVMCAGWGDVSSKTLGVAGILLLVVYVAAAHANSRLDQDNTVAWAVFAVMGIELAAAVAAVLSGTSGQSGAWPLMIAAAIVGIAAAVSLGNRRA